jgi:hypothetical protein
LLADFGIAREVDDIGGLTATNMVVGTTAYFVPEHPRNHPEPTAPDARMLPLRQAALPDLAARSLLLELKLVSSRRGRCAPCHRAR